MEQLKATLRSVEYASQIQDIDQDTAQRITKLIGDMGQHQQCDDIAETTAAQLQGLLTEALPPRHIQDETVSGSKATVLSECGVTAHDRFLCSIRATHDNTVRQTPEHVYVDAISGVARIHYIATDEISTPDGQDEFHVHNITECPPDEDPRLVASIQDINSALQALSFQEGELDEFGDRVCHIADYTRGQCCRVAPTYRHKPKGQQ